MTSDTMTSERVTSELMSSETPTYQTITVTPSTPHIGAEIGNIDLTRPLTNRQVKRCTTPSSRTAFIFFRDQKIDFAAHERFVRYFGEPHVHVGGAGTASQAVPGHPAIRLAIFRRAIPSASRAKNGIPTRAAPRSRRCTASSTRSIVPPNGGGDTYVSVGLQGLRRTQPVDEDVSGGQDRDP